MPQIKKRSQPEERDQGIAAQQGRNTDGSLANEKPDPSLCGHGNSDLDENLNCPPVRRTADGKQIPSTDASEQ